MYANCYDDGTLMDSYIGWSKRLARIRQRTLGLVQEAENMKREEEESTEVRAAELRCSKCKGLSTEGENAAAFPHIQDLCPADRRRIAQLVKQLIKCTKETRDAKSELAACEAEKEAMQNQYQQLLDRRETDKKQLEFELSKSRGEADSLKSRFSRALELLSGQLGELTETVRLEVEKSLRTKEIRVLKVHRSCQTREEAPEGPTEKSEENVEKIKVACRAQNPPVKRKDDLDQLSREETLIRDLFFRQPSIEETGTLDIIPVLSKTGL